MLVRQAEIFSRWIDVFCAGFAMSLGRSRHFRNTFAGERVTDDKLRFSVIAFLRDIAGVKKLLHVVTLDLLHVESISLISLPSVFALRLLRHGIERDSVGIVNQNQIIETEMAGECARFRGYALLETTVARETKNMLIKNPML